MGRSLAQGRSLAEHSAALTLVFILVALAGPVLGNNYTVNGTADETDADPSTGNCVSTPSGVCPLRAAIMVANFVTRPNTITIPSGSYVLTIEATAGTHA
jgi:CSLREA domain-containing protein